MSEPERVRRELLHLSMAVVVAFVFMAVALVDGATRPDYDAWQQPVSALSLGPCGGVARIALVVFGATILSTAVPWSRLLRGGKGAMAYPILMALSGVGVVVCGFARQDPAPGYDPEHLALAAPTAVGLLHMAAAACAVLASVVGLVIIARRFDPDPGWRGFAIYSRAMAFATVLCVAVYGVLSRQPHGYAGTFERVALMATPVWGLTLLVRLWRGAPLPLVFVHTSGARPPAECRVVREG